MVSCLSCIGGDSSLADTRSKCLNKGMLILSNLELPALPYVSAITAISQLPEYRLYYVQKLSGSLVWRVRVRSFPANPEVALCGGDLSLSKAYEGPLSYAEGSSLTLRNHFIQPYRMLDTLFSKYY